MVAGLTPEELQLLTSDEQGRYFAEVQDVQKSETLHEQRDITLSKDWRSEFDFAFGLAFFLGSAVLYPTAVALAGSDLMSFSISALIVYVGLLLAISAAWATFASGLPLTIRSQEDLRLEAIDSVVHRWRTVVGQRQLLRDSPALPRAQYSSVEKPASGSESVSSPRRYSSLSDTPVGSKDRSRYARGKSSNARQTGLTSNNRSIPGNEFTPWIGASQKKAVADRFGWICQLCLRPINPRIRFDYESPHPDRLVIDHIRPRAAGGSDHWRNLQPAHHRCNLQKGSQWISNDEFRRRFGQTRSDKSVTGADRSAAQSRTRSASSPFMPQSRRQSRAVPSARRPRVTSTSAVPQYGPSGPYGNQSSEQSDRSDLFWATDHTNLLSHCDRGHEFTEENTYYRIRNDRRQRIERECRTCRRA